MDFNTPTRTVKTPVRGGGHALPQLERRYQAPGNATIRNLLIRAHAAAQTNRFAQGGAA